MINIALSGAYGTMCSVIAKLSNAKTDFFCKITAGIDINSQPADFPAPVYGNPFDIVEPVDVIIDFSHPAALPNLLTFCKMKNIPLVAATTGYNAEEVAEIKNASAQIPIFFTGNMSLGINLLQDLARRAVRVLGDGFDVEIIERHHSLKKDAPSGTAHMLANSINCEYNNTKKYVYDRHNVLKPREKQEIGIHAVRGGTIVGEHEIVFAGHDEIITLSHSALSKEVFAVGAINAAIFLKTQVKQAGLYDMSDLLKSV
jgi:4-hydroxy-tetrahydrodipicolinate reductase